MVGKELNAEDVEEGEERTPKDGNSESLITFSGGISELRQVDDVDDCDESRLRSANTPPLLLIELAQSYIHAYVCIILQNITFFLHLLTTNNTITSARRLISLYAHMRIIHMAIKNYKILTNHSSSVMHLFPCILLQSNTCTFHFKLMSKPI